MTWPSLAPVIAAAPGTGTLDVDRKPCVPEHDLRLGA